MIMLIIAAVVSIVLSMTLEDPHTHKVERSTGWIEGVAILLSVALVVMVSSVSDYQKAKKFEELNRESAKKPVMCIRNGHRQLMDAAELLVGDLVEFEYGQQLSADFFYLRGSEVKCDESAATGEGDYIKKSSDKDPFLISGTNVVEGRGVPSSLLLVSIRSTVSCPWRREGQALPKRRCRSSWATWRARLASLAQLPPCLC